MIGLLKKDLYLIVKNFSFTYLIILIAPVFAAFSNPQDAMFIFSLMVALLFAFQITNTMALDESAHWNQNVTAMPVTRFCEALSKYLLAVLLSTGAAACVGVIGLIWNLALFPIPKPSFMMYLGIRFAVVLLYGCVIIPASYRFGTAKSRYVFMLFVFVPAGTPLVLKALHINVDLSFFYQFNGSSLVCGMAAFLVLCMLLSLILSVSILQHRKEC